jgi:Putative alpha-1,2-mannosidase
MVHG